MKPPQTNTVAYLPFALAFAALAACGETASSPAPLDAGAPPTTCVFPTAPASHASIALVEAFAGLGLEQPLGLYEPVPGIVFVQERTGRLRRFQKAATSPGTVATAFQIPADRIDLRGEGGFLGVAFAPDFPAVAKVYVSYTYRNASGDMHSEVAEVSSPDNGVTFPFSARRVLLDVAQPFTNHDGGALLFGADQKLYIAFGDGGSGGDPLGNGQNGKTFLGKILRIDPTPSGGNPYTIPSDNPFVGDASRLPEIYALGLRNPWRFTRDRETGALYAGDVGQGAWEEIDRILAGRNYGWNTREGRHCFSTTPCDVGGPFEEPLVEHGRDEAQSITGGYVYRGGALPQLRGKYIYGDYVKGNIFAFDPAAGTAAIPEKLLTIGGGDVAGFAEDAAGELYVLRVAASRIDRIVGNAPAPIADGFPTRLSETGCIETGSAATPAAGLVSYTPIAPFWSDGAKKDRAFVLPPAQPFLLDSDGDYRLPPLGVTMKTFRDPADGRPLETRFFVRHADGTHAGYTYLWRADGRDADLAVGGEEVRGTSVSYTLPTRAECLNCHSNAAGYLLGLEAAQLTPSARSTLELAGYAPPAPAQLRRLVDPSDTSASLDDRAASYLHTNCSNCHRPGGGGRGDLDLRAEATLAAKGCDRPPTTSDLGLANARVLAPGAPERSTLAQRMVRPEVRMPPLGSRTLDAEGGALIAAWIRALPGCP